MSFYALLLIAQLSTPIDEYRNQNYDFWIQQLRSSSVDIRTNAMQKLVEMKDERAVREIKRFFESEEPILRYQAAVSLGRIYSEASLLALSNHVNEEDDVYIRSEMERSINRLKEVFEKNAEEEETSDMPER